MIHVWRIALKLTCVPSPLLKYCQTHNGSKALSTLAHSTSLVQSRSFNNHWSKFTLVLFDKGQQNSYNNIEKPHVTNITKECSNIDQSR